MLLSFFSLVKVKRAPIFFFFSLVSFYKVNRGPVCFLFVNITDSHMHEFSCELAVVVSFMVR